MRYAVFGIFILSGAAGLIFEVVWARQLVLVFGNTTQAISAILTGFFGGLAVGSWFGGKLSDRMRRPLALYGFLELLLVLVVLLTPVTFGLVREVYRSAFDWLEHAPRMLALVRFFLTMIALAPATVLMGATLPTLTRVLSRTAHGLSSAFSGLYLANTVGAILGTIVSGMVLIELLGLHGTLVVGAACSGMAGLTALGLDRKVRSARAEPDGFRSQAVATHPESPTLRLALLVAFVSGLTSLAYQTLWMRLISSGTGSSTYIFTIVLAIFLTGLAMGAAAYKRFEARVVVINLLAVTQLVTSVLAVLGMLALLSLDAVPHAFLWKSLVVVLPTTLVIGVSLPASAALLGGSDADVGAKSGSLLAANTLGAIVGTFVVPFAIIPLVGSPAALGLTALLNALMSIVLVSRAGEALRRKRALAIAGGLMFGSILFSIVATDGLFIDPNVSRLRSRGAALYRSTEDEIASVQSGSLGGYKRLWVAGFGMTLLSVDAKLMPILPLILRPASRTLLGIAFGMGSAHRAALIAGLKADVVELVPSVLMMFDNYYPDARSVLADSRSRVIIADGRNYVELTDRKYDIIIVDPPPPVESAGVSVISSLEFYHAVKTRLNAGGVMMQFVPGGQNLDEFKAHVRTFRRVYPHVIVASGPGANGFYMLGSEEPLAASANGIRAALYRPGVLADVSSAFDSPAHTFEAWSDLIPRLVHLSDDEVTAFVGHGPLVTDDHPRPEYFLLRHLFGKRSVPLSRALVHPPRR